MHARQAKTETHVLSEISSVLKAQEDLEHKLALVRESSVEQTRRRTATEDEIESKKRMVSAEFKAEEEKRSREVEEKAAQLAKQAAEIKAAAELEGRLRKTEEEQRMRQLEEEQARIKVVLEEEAQRWKADEDELILEKQTLEETLARVKVVVPFSSVLYNSASSSLASPRSLQPTHPDATVVIDQEASRLSATASGTSSMAFLRVLGVNYQVAFCPCVHVLFPCLCMCVYVCMCMKTYR